jgi:penicillin-binding protein 1B
MWRMSRAIRLPRWSLVIAAIIFITINLVFITIFRFDRRIRRELVGQQWRQPTTILSASGAELIRVWGADWRLTPPVLLRTLPPHVANAFLAAEDVRFRSHIGIDPVGMLRALVTNVRAGGIAQGGSTIDQQLIKSKFLTQERTFRRKVFELILAVDLDARVSKDDILEAYLNQVYLGHYLGKPVLGIEEGSRLYLNKEPRQLTPGEAAMLAGIVRAPNRDTPDKRPEVVRARRNAILAVMRKQGWLDDEGFSRGSSEEAAFDNGSLPPMPWPWYLVALHGELVRRLGPGVLLEGGVRVQSELDPAMQQSAERAVRRGAALLTTRFNWIAQAARHEPLESGVLMIDAPTGGLRAMVGGTDHRTSTFDHTTAMRRQPGSAFKTFAYLAAIVSRKVTAATLLRDSPLQVQLANNSTWEPRNYDERFRGRVTLRQAFEGSLNVPTVRLMDDIGLGRVISTARKAGFEEDFQEVPALPLGVTEVTMTELTAAYTIFPNLGVRTTAYLLRSVKDRSGRLLYEHEPATTRVVDAAPAFVMHSLLRGVVQHGTATRLKRYGLGDVAGKTGTTSDYRDAWFVGYSGNLVTSVWVGFDHGAPLRLSSAEAAIPIWASCMTGVNRRPRDLPAPEGVAFRDIDPETGMLWREGCPGPVHEVFLTGTAPTHSCPRGIFGGVVRRVFFGGDSFDEPAAITFDKFRRMAADVDQGRQRIRSGLDRVKGWLHRRP